MKLLKTPLTSALLLTFSTSVLATATASGVDTFDYNEDELYKEMEARALDISTTFNTTVVGGINAELMKVDELYRESQFLLNQEFDVVPEINPERTIIIEKIMTHVDALSEDLIANEDLVVRLLSGVSKQGYALADYELAKVLARNELKAYDPVKAKQYMVNAAKQSSMLYPMAWHCFAAEDGPFESRAMATELIHFGFDQGYPLAMLNVVVASSNQDEMALFGITEAMVSEAQQKMGDVDLTKLSSSDFDRIFSVNRTLSGALVNPSSMMNEVLRRGNAEQLMLQAVDLASGFDAESDCTKAEPFIKAALAKPGLHQEDHVFMELVGKCRSSAG
ncbi:hypothetical protein AB6D11_06135 [Vibrio splendidus]